MHFTSVTDNSDNRLTNSDENLSVDGEVIEETVKLDTISQLTAKCYEWCETWGPR